MLLFMLLKKTASFTAVREADKILVREVLKRVFLFNSLKSLSCWYQNLLSALSASLGHTMGDISAMSQGDWPQVLLLYDLFYSVMEIHLTQWPVAKPVGSFVGHL